ncbi:hypothetical protein Cgig2_000633 [Carnegiea gigantea]|uniref:Aminotransferase-like plant mobile domain-containing protein n=1 Tax=Carnegiea gigantea TaxID=171969 RepID=A0A9Q1KD05_9CARY|nr:hypothetical protein Cgig2_000633 [Carnegiea gigantea]
MKLKPIVEATDIGEENSHNDSEKGESTYENEEGGSGTSTPSLSLQEEVGKAYAGAQKRAAKVRVGKGHTMVDNAKEKLLGVQNTSSLLEGAEKVIEASVDAVIRHRCTLEAVCALNDELDDDRKRAIKETMWSPVLEYRSFVTDRHLVRALIKCWNTDTKSFKLKWREMPFSFYDVVLITGLPAHGKPILFECSEAISETNPVFEVREEEIMQAVMRAFIDTNEYQGYKEDAEMKDGRPDIGGEALKGRDQSVVEPGEGSSTPLHHCEKDNVVILLSLYVRSTEVSTSIAGDLSSKNINLHSNAVDNDMDVGQATSKDSEVGKSTRQVVVLASPTVHIEEGHNGGEMGMEEAYMGS